MILLFIIALSLVLTIIFILLRAYKVLIIFVGIIIGSVFILSYLERDSRIIYQGTSAEEKYNYYWIEDNPQVIKVMSFLSSLNTGTFILSIGRELPTIDSFDLLKNEDVLFIIKRDSLYKEFIYKKIEDCNLLIDVSQENNVYKCKFIGSRLDIRTFLSLLSFIISEGADNSEWILDIGIRRSVKIGFYDDGFFDIKPLRYNWDYYY